MSFGASFAAGAGVRQNKQALQQKDRELKQKEQQQMIEGIGTTIASHLDTYTKMYTQAVQAGKLEDPGVQAGLKAFVDDAMALSGKSYPVYGDLVPNQRHVGAMFGAVAGQVQTPERMAEIAGMEEAAKTTARETAQNTVNQVTTLTRAELQAEGLPPGTIAQRGADNSLDIQYTPPSQSTQYLSAIVHGEDRPTTILVKDGVFSRTHSDGSREIVPSAMITPVSVQGGASDVVPASRRDALVERRDSLEFQISETENMIALLEADPTLGGIAGSIRRAGQTATGAFNDLSDLFNAAGVTSAGNVIQSARRMAEQELESGNIDENMLVKLFDDPTLSELRLLENALGFTLARIRTDDGRLLKSVVDMSIKDAKITGLTSAKDAINRMKSIVRQLHSPVASLNRRIGDRPEPGRGKVQRPSEPPGPDASVEEILLYYGEQ